MPFLTLLWANRELIAKGIGIALIGFLCWWYFFHNPKVIKSLETTIQELSRQVELRDSALELQGQLRKAHDEITAKENENIRRIRETPLAASGVFIPGGVPKPLP